MNGLREIELGANRLQFSLSFSCTFVKIYDTDIKFLNMSIRGAHSLVMGDDQNLHELRKTIISFFTIHVNHEIL